MISRHRRGRTNGIDLQELSEPEAKKIEPRVKIFQRALFSPHTSTVNLLDITTKKLEMDFVLEGDRYSLRVLNAVSPAFTCSLPFADHVCDEIERWTHAPI